MKITTKESIGLYDLKKKFIMNIEIDVEDFMSEFVLSPKEEVIQDMLKQIKQKLEKIL
jgi:hypothetical protein